MNPLILNTLLRRGCDPQKPERSVLTSPSVGYFCQAPQLGAIVRAGDELGTLEQLGRVTRLIVPEHAHGRVVEVVSPDSTRKAVGYGQVLVVLEPAGSTSEAGQNPTDASSATHAAAQVFVSPTSGRFYAKPAPDRPTFFTVGEVIEPGKTIGLIEVMKTFTRIHFQAGAHNGASPGKVRVTEILVSDQDEIAAGAPLFRFEICN